LQLPDAFNTELELFLASVERPEWSWVHQVRQRKFHEGYNNLRVAAAKETSSLATKKILASLSKLAAVSAGIGEDPAVTSEIISICQPQIPSCRECR